MIRSRCSCARPPWSAAASRPRPLSASARSSTSPRVRANTSVAVAVLEVEDPAERGELVRPADDVGDLADPRGLAGGRLGLDPDRDRVPQVPPGEPRDRPRDRGREQRRLVDLGQRAEDPLEVVGEAHVEHLVGLVEHDGLDLVEADRPALEVVDRAARRRDDDVDAAREPVELRGDRLAAVDGHDPRAELAAVLVDRLGDLHRELAGRRQDERPGPAPAARPSRGAPRPSTGSPGARCSSSRAASRWSSGRANAAVLPVPVGASASRSLAARAAAGSPRSGSASAPRSRAPASVVEQPRVEIERREPRAFLRGAARSTGRRPPRSSTPRSRERRSGVTRLIVSPIAGRSAPTTVRRRRPSSSSSRYLTPSGRLLVGSRPCARPGSSRCSCCSSPAAG